MFKEMIKIGNSVVSICLFWVFKSTLSFVFNYILHVVL